MRILILNWRCPRNPRAGGAEIVTHEIARRLVAWGHQVEWFSATFPGAANEEILDGIRILRSGRQWTVHWRAFRRYHRRLRGNFDAVIDEVNTVPFFTPLWAEIPRFMFIHQLAREVWWYESRFPVSGIGYLAEPLYLRLYRRSPVLTVSPSTREDLRSLGFVGPISIVPEGLGPIPQMVSIKQKIPTFLYVGRLAASKRVTDIVQAFAEFRRTVRPAQLWLVGDGVPPYITRLTRLIQRLQLSDSITYWGRVDAPTKHRLMGEAHALVMASVREGWGLVTIEANAVGTPAVVYDVGGLRDAVLHEKTGLVVPPSPRGLASGMLRIWRDGALYESLASNATIWGRSFSFDMSARAVRDQVGATISGAARAGAY